ncbi:hypothetical protein Pelo_12814 [Pelomyxa schiedti]|nr:hypothetical protein Pelo_12814 [Pelomyxa schiedti]
MSHVELKEVFVDAKKGADAKQQVRPEFSLIPPDHWESCLSLFNTLTTAGTEENLVSVEDVKQQWRQDHKGASQFEIERIANMVEHEKNGKMSLKGFALGCALFPENRSMLPKHCSVKEYIHTGFGGSSNLSILCESPHKRNAISAKWVVLLVANFILSVASIGFWPLGLLGITTCLIALYLHWFGGSALFMWRNVCLSGTILVFAFGGLMDLTVGFTWGIFFMGTEYWFLFWPCWCIFQVVYMMLSTIYIANVCRLFCGLSHDSIVSVPKYTIFTSHIIATWVLLFLDAFFIAVLITVGVIWKNLHSIPICCIGGFLGASVLPATVILMAMLIKGYPKRMVIAGLMLSALLTLVSVASIVAFWFTGSWIYIYL